MAALVDEYGIHGALHALIEVCYRKAAEVDPAEFKLLCPPQMRVENWRRLAKEITAVEMTAAHLDF